MLARIRGAETVCARIENLDLSPRRFDVALLGSYLVNLDSDAVVSAYLSTCRRHVAAAGSVPASRGTGWG